MVRAGESLMKLVSDLKQYLILNDFPRHSLSPLRQLLGPGEGSKPSVLGILT